MKVFLFSVFAASLCILSTAGKAHADNPWGHIGRECTDGSQISIDYQTPPADGGTTSSAEVYVNVTNSGASDCKVSVQALIETNCGTPEKKSIEMLPQPETNGCRFSNDQSVSILATTHAGDCKQQLSITVKGNPLIEKVANGNGTGTKIFSFTLPFLPRN